MDEYLTKPVLLRLLREALEKWLIPANTPTAPLAPPQEARAAQAVAAVDVTVLKALVGDDPDTVRGFLSDYLVSARRLAAELRAAFAAGDARQVGAIAHKLKSSSRSVGALALGDQCVELENAGKAGDRAAIAKRMAGFEATLGTVEAQIAGVLEGKP